MSVEGALEIAVAANPAGEIVTWTIEIDHVTFDQPARIACNVQDDVVLPPAAGQPAVTWTAIGVDVIPPGVDDDGPTPARLRLDLVSRTLLPYLESAAASTTPVSVTFRVYTSLDLSGPCEVWPGYELRVAALSATSAEATVALPDVATQEFPLATYDATYYPALQND